MYFEFSPIVLTQFHQRAARTATTAARRFAAGITLSEFRAVSADENWVEAFISNSLKGVHKLVKLQGLSVYFDTDAQRMMQGDRDEIIAALKTMLERPPKHQYILKPVTGEARVSVLLIADRYGGSDGALIYRSLSITPCLVKRPR